MNNYDFLYGNDFTWIKITLGNDHYHTIKVQAALAKVVDFSGDLRNLEEIIITKCPKFTRILWPKNAHNIKRLKIGNCSMLSSLDLSALVNLEELSIINCKNLTSIIGLGENIRSINIQGGKLTQLDSSQCKKIKQFILTTHTSNLNLNFTDCDVLQSIIIHVNTITSNKPNDSIRTNIPGVVCFFERCTQLNTLYIKSLDAPTHIDIMECPALQNNLIFLGEYPNDIPLDDDTVRRTEELEHYLLKCKKTSLKMPENSDDIETIIQENGISPKKKKACLVKLELLMKTSTRNYQDNFNQYVIKNNEGGIDKANVPVGHIFPNIMSANRTETNRGKKRGTNTLKDHSLNLMQSYAPSYIANIANPLSSANKYSAIHSVTEYSKIMEFNHFKEQKEYLNLRKNPYPIKGIYNDALITTLPSIFKELKPNKPSKPQTPQKARTAKLNTSGYVPHYYYKKNIKKIKPTSGILLIDSLSAAQEQLKNDLPSLAKKYEIAVPRLFFQIKEDETDDDQGPDSQEDLYGVGKEKQAPEHLLVHPELIANDGKESPLSVLKFDSKKDLKGAAKEKVVAHYLTAEPELIADAEEERPLSVLKLKITFDAQKDLARTRKRIAGANDLITTPELVADATEQSSLRPLRFTQSFSIQNELEGNDKLKVKSKFLAPAPKLTSYQIEHNALSALILGNELDVQSGLSEAAKTTPKTAYLCVNSALSNYDAENTSLSALAVTYNWPEPVAVPDSEAINFNVHVVRSLIDLKPRDSEYFTEFIPSFPSNSTQQILNDVQNHLANQATLTTAEKTTTEGAQLIVNPSLTIDNEDTQQAMLSLVINEDRVVPDVLSVYEPEENNFEFHIARALVDLKLRDTNLFNDDFTQFYLADLNERMLKKIQNDSAEDLTAVEKISSAGNYLTSAPVLSAYDEVQSTSLIALTIEPLPQEDLANSEEINFNFHVIRALIDLKPNDMEDYTHDFIFRFFADLNEPIIDDIKKELASQEDLSAAGKVTVTSQVLSAAPELTSYEDQNSFLSALEIREELTLPGNVISNLLSQSDTSTQSLEPDSTKHIDLADYLDDELLDSLLEDERELLFPQSKKLSSHFLFDALLPITKASDNEINLKKVSDAQTNYTVMDQIPGRDLFTIIMDDYKGIDVLSTNERIELSEALLLALKSQVSDQGFIHRDIKPQNIIVDLNAPIRVTIINLDLSIDTPVDQVMGTEGYFAPENITDPMGISAKSDVYSLGRVIALLWHADLSTYIDDVPYSPQNFRPQDLLADLFADIADLDEVNQLSISKILAMMLDNDPIQRLSIDEAIETFAYVGREGVPGDHWLWDNNWIDGEFISDADLEAMYYVETELAPEMDDGFESVKDLLIECGLLDDVLNDETGELLKQILDRINRTTDAQKPSVVKELSPAQDLNLINLKRVSDADGKQLAQFFADQSVLGISSWAKNLIYTFADGREFTLKHEVFQRARKATHDGVRYEVISNKALIGKGGFGEIRQIKGTVALDAEQEQIHFKSQGSDGKRRVVKIQTHSEYFNPLTDYYRGFDFAQRAGHLALKEPTVIAASADTQTSYTVMDQIQGRDLFDIIMDDYEGIDVLSTDERIELSEALLLALKSQVSDRGFIHRDIKPENIMVNLNAPISVTIIDYDMSIDTPDGQVMGTEGYYAPENITDPMGISAKSDVYSLGRVLALIWRVDFTSYQENFSYTPESLRAQDLLAELCNDITDLDEVNKLSIRKILTMMLDHDPNQRLSIDEAIETFAYVGGEGVPGDHWLWDNNWINGEFVSDADLETMYYAQTQLPPVLPDSAISEPVYVDEVASHILDHSAQQIKTKVSDGHFGFFQPPIPSQIYLSEPVRLKND